MEQAVLTILGLLVLLNAAFVIYTIVINRRESNRLKAIAEAKAKWEQAAREKGKV